METIAPADHRLFSLLVLYDMHTTFFSKVLEGISENNTHNRLNTEANHIAWLTGSLVEQRYELARSFGIQSQQSAHELFKDNKGIQGNARYPSLATYKTDWESISPLLKQALVDATESQLNGPIDMPGMTMSLFDLIAFITYREANCIGQIALWRRLLGYQAMNYM